MNRQKLTLFLLFALAINPAWASCELKQSTASQEVLLGPFLDDTDGNTPETGLTIANTDIRLSPAAGNIVAKTSGGGTHDELGMYQITLDATDTATVGSLDIIVASTGALIVWKECYVYEEAVYDNIYAAAAVGPLTAAQVNTEADTALTDYDPPTNTEMIARTLVTASYFDPAADTVGTVTTLTGHTAQTGDTYALANGATGFVAINTDVELIVADTNELQADDYPARFTGVEGATFATGTDSLEAIRDRGDAAWTTGAGTGLTPIASGTAQAGTASTIQLASGETFGNDILNGNTVCVNAGTGDGQCRNISDYVGATDTATVEPDWITNPASGATYEVIMGSVNVAVWNGAVVTTALETASDIVDEWETQSQADPTGFHVNVQEIGGTAQTANDNGADINAILVDTGTTLPALIATAQADLDILTGADGVNLLSATQASIDAIVADTNELQTDDIPGLLATAQADLDTLTGTDGATLATAQALYAPAVAGDNMGTVSSVTGNVDGNVTGSVGSLTGHTAQTGDNFAALEMLGLLDTALLNCEVNTANFAGSTTTLACILTDRDDGAVTQATGDLEGLQIVVTSGAQIRETRYVIDSTWDAGNSELQLTLSRALPATLADAVTVIIR